jgi:DNA adenine methylase
MEQSDVVDQAAAEPLAPIDPIRPPAPWIGGKSAGPAPGRADQRGAAHDLCRAFVGMGGVFRRDQRPKCEVINDWSEDVATFFRVVQPLHRVHGHAALAVTSRAGFERLRAQDPATLTDLERAARFLTCKSSVRRESGLPHLRHEHDRRRPLRRGQSRPPDRSRPRTPLGRGDRAPALGRLTRYDRPGTLFYLDPPYYGCEGDYGKTLFDRDEFTAMATHLRTLKGRFILSLNDHPDVRRIFEGFTIEPVPVRYTVGGPAQSKIATEVIISG